MNFHSRLLILAVTLFLMPGKPGFKGTDSTGAGISTNAFTSAALMGGLETALTENTMLPTLDHRTGKTVARCYGKDRCNACSNCSQCQHCNAGGSCGKCIKKAPPKQGAYSNSLRTQPQRPAQQRPQPAASGQCRAITKKGTQCSRRATHGKFCYQHG
jgi:hypothetical protein